jgi:hypothetical protein
MTPRTSDATMAVFLDLENIALGARDAKYPSFDVQQVLARLLLKGHIVVKKAYCDFDRYKDFKRGLHEAAFERRLRFLTAGQQIARERQNRHRRWCQELHLGFVHQQLR